MSSQVVHMLAEMYNMSPTLLVNEHVVPALTPFHTLHENERVLASDFNLGGHCCFIKLSNRTALDNLKHYLQCKVNKPNDTSAIILVPRTQRTRKLSKYLANMMKGSTLPPGSSVLVSIDGTPIANECPIDVYVDKPGTTHDRLSNINNNLTFKLQAVVSNVKTNVLLDTGATGCFISQSFVQRMGLHVDQPNRAIEPIGQLKSRLLAATKFVPQAHVECISDFKA